MIPDHFSWSQINMLYRCGEQYRRRYVGGERTPPGFAFARGRSADEATNKNLTEKMNTGMPLEIDDVYAAAADAFDALVEREEHVVDGIYSDLEPEAAAGKAKDEAVAMAGLHAGEVAPSITPTAVQPRLEIAPSDVLPVTFVSILDVIDNKDVVRDTKTSQKTPTRTTADDSDQLTSQALAFQATYGFEPVSLHLDYLVMTPKRGTLNYVHQETTRTQADMGTFLNRAQTALRVIEAEVFLPAPTDSWACSERFCGYTATCPYFRGQKRPTT